MSYLTSRPSRDLVVVANQEVTREWWSNERPKYDLFISEMVLQEISAGDPLAVENRRSAIAGIPILRLNNDVTVLAKALIQGLALPPNSYEDALHISLAVVYGIDYLLTWNCSHIANAVMQKNIQLICSKLGYVTPVICTPMELLGE